MRLTLRPSNEHRALLANCSWTGKKYANAYESTGGEGGEALMPNIAYNNNNKQYNNNNNISLNAALP